MDKKYCCSLSSTMATVTVTKVICANAAALVCILVVTRLTACEQFDIYSGCNSYYPPRDRQ